MVKAFVFGKFLPFHKGHEAMIRYALGKCDFLTVLICCSDQETIGGDIRKSWISKTFTDKENIEIRVYHYLESELPNTSASSKAVSKAWAEVFKQLLTDYSLLVTSEPYGDFVADFMHIQHLGFDVEKKLFPVSATAIRNDLFTHWNYLPDSVKPYFAIKVVLLGTESTGKTTLMEKLAAHFHCSKVPEAARELIENSNAFSIEDLHLVAQAHAKRIEQATILDSPLIMIDTDIHTTQSYGRFTFGKNLEVSDEIYHINKAHLYLYLANDVAYFQDGTRLNEADRDLLDLSHRQILTKNKIDFFEIKGDWEERFETAVAQIKKLIAIKTQMEPR